MKISSQWCAIAIAAACALAAATPAHAQKKAQGPFREGFWIGVGLGYGGATISCSGCTDNSRLGAPTFTLRMGGTPSRQVLIGGELNAWSRSESGVTETVGDMSAVALWYPGARSPVFLKGGVGVVVYQANSSPKLESEGFGLNLGAGIDLYTGRSFSITPFVTYITALGGNLKVGGTDTGFAIKPNMIEVGITATWH